MRRMLFILVVAALFAPASPSQQNKRPHIYGIAGVRLYVSNLSSARAFYSTVTNTKRACDWCETQEPSGFRLPSGQFILLSLTPASGVKNPIAELSFDADNLKQLTHLLKANRIPYKQEESDGQITIVRVRDPEGHAIAFLQAGVPRKYRAYHPVSGTDSSVSERLIHAGFAITDKAAMDHFYKDLLGFQLYWQGGKNDGETDWIDMQVPDGTDWVEYMLNVPSDGDVQALGELNHFALGVLDVRQTDSRLLDDTQLKLSVSQKPSIGRDGRWQMDLHDPDNTLVELMEFTPVEKPCCTEYTGAHPVP